MPTIQSAEIWKESGRYDDYGEEMLRIKDRQGKEMLIWSYERRINNRNF